MTGRPKKVLSPWLRHQSGATKRPSLKTSGTLTTRPWRATQPSTPPSKGRLGTGQSAAIVSSENATSRRVRVSWLATQKQAAAVPASWAAATVISWRTWLRSRLLDTTRFSRVTVCRRWILSWPAA